MSELEPDDSRKVTHGASKLALEPERTGIREDRTRKQARAKDGGKDGEE